MSQARGRKRQSKYELYEKQGGPALNIGWQLEEAGFAPGDRVEVQYGNGYVVIVPANADVAATDADPRYRDNIPDVPIESAFEAHVIGNRLWEMGEKYADIGHEHVAEETKHLARRFHSFAKNDTSDETV